MKKRLFSLTSIAFLFTTSFAHAEWMKEKEAPVAIVDTSDDVTIDADGNYESIRTSEMKVLNEQGRNALVLQTVPVIPDAMTVTFVSGSSKTEGIETPVNPKQVIVRSAQGPQQGISHLKEMVIPFDNLKIGSTTKFTVKVKSKKTMVKGLYQQSYVFGVHAPEYAGRAKIKSLIPLYTQINDPWGVVSSKDSKEGNYYVFEFTQTKPVFKVPEKELLSIITRGQMSRVDVSTMNNWNAFVTPIATKYEEILTVKNLPETFKRIANKTKIGKTTSEKIDIVTSELASIMTYKGTWTSFEKMYIAQPLAKIAKVKTGDCKDFSLVTTAILRSIGIDAKIALVMRTPRSSGVTIVENDEKPLVNPNLFNHAIVKVQADGKTLWVDPTNIVSNSSYINTDIADSLALEVSSSVQNLERLPYSDASSSLMTFDKDIVIRQDTTSDVTGSFTATGEYAKSILEASFAKSEDTAKKVLKTYLRTEPDNNVTFPGIPFRNRIASKIQGKFLSAGEEIVKWDDQKLYLDVGFPTSIAVYLAYQGYRSTDAYLPATYSEKTITRVKSYNVVGYPPECTLVTPWFRFTRAYFKDATGFRVEDDLQVIKSRISAKEINSDTFKNHVSAIRTCATDRFVQIKPATKDITKQDVVYTIDKAQSEYDQRTTKGFKNSYHIANNILAATPDHKEATILKSRALRNLNPVGDEEVEYNAYRIESGTILTAIADKYPNDPKILQQLTWNAIYKKDTANLSKLFNEAYKVSAKDFDLYMLGGTVLEEMNQNTAAIGSYSKALAAAQSNGNRRNAASSLGSLLVKTNDIPKAIAYFKYAIDLEPGQASNVAQNGIWFLTQAGRIDEAISFGEEIVRKVHSDAANINLAETYSIKGLQTLHQKADNPLDVAKNQDAAESAFTRGLSHSANNSSCLSGMFEVYAKRAIKDKNPMTAQRALKYLDKALNTNRLDPDAFEDKKALIVAITEGKDISRMPANIFDAPATKAAVMVKPAISPVTAATPSAPAPAPANPAVAAPPVATTAPAKTPAPVQSPAVTAPAAAVPAAPVTPTKTPASVTAPSTPPASAAAPAAPVATVAPAATTPPAAPAAATAPTTAPAASAK
jgi:tetratricopeptide (TPR) repeat protein